MRQTPNQINQQAVSALHKCTASSQQQQAAAETHIRSCSQTCRQRAKQLLQLPQHPQQQHLCSALQLLRYSGLL
jgi:hypothetical protein